jgi:hypothetical protein
VYLLKSIYDFASSLSLFLNSHGKILHSIDNKCDQIIDSFPRYLIAVLNLVQDIFINESFQIFWKIIQQDEVFLSFFDTYQDGVESENFFLNRKDGHRLKQDIAELLEEYDHLCKYSNNGGDIVNDFSTYINVHFEEEMILPVNNYDFLTCNLQKVETIITNALV